MTLFDITDDYQRLLSIAEEPDADPQTVADTLESIEGEFEDKVMSTACVMDQISMDIAALDEVIKRYQAMKKAKQNVLNAIGDRVMMAMRLTGKTRITTPLRTVSLQRNSVPSIKLDVPNVWAVPEEYRRYKEPEIDLQKISKAIKDGKNIDFAHVEYGFHLRYK